MSAHGDAIRLGQARAKARGVQLGRPAKLPRSADLSDEFMTRFAAAPSYEKLVLLYQAGMSIAEMSANLGLSDYPGSTLRGWIKRYESQSTKEDSIDDLLK